MLERRPKRFLLDPEPTQIEPNITDIASDPDYIGSGSLLTQRDTDGARQELLLTSRSSFVIGRDPAICDYVVSSPFVSKRHLRLFATRNERNEAITCVEDTSANGILLNGQRPKTRSIILSEGDVIELPQARKSFEYREQPRADEPLATPKPGLNASNSKFLVVGRYKIHLKKSLGSGSFGVVRLAWDTMREIQVACKTIKKSRLDERTGDRVRLINEIQLGLILRHPNLNPILAFHETETEYHIFLSLVTGGDLFSYVTKHQGLDEAEAKFLAYQLMQGVKYLHDRGCAHRDLKPENILLKSGGSFPTLLICDFGLSTRTDITKGQPQRAGKTAAVRAGSLVGTIDYMYIRASRFVASHRDEIQRGVKIKLSPLDATKSDCWALGVLIFIMATGCHPFGFQNSDIDDVANEFQIARSRDHHAQLDVPQDFGARIEQGSISFSLPVWKSYHPRVRDLLHHLLDPSPHLRLSVVGALAHAWFEMDRAVLEQCYEMRVLARAAAADDEGHKKMK